MFFSTFLFLTPATINIKSRVDEISPLNEFGPTLEGLMRGLLFVGALLTFFYLLWGALDWILSQGDSGKVEAARKKITSALVGLAVLASVGAVFLVLQTFLGINILQGGTPAKPQPCNVGQPCLIDNIK